MERPTIRSTVTPPVSGAGETHHGGRETNQDVFIADAKLGLFAVFDGLGGHAAGDIAAQMASDAVIAFITKHASSGRFTPRELLEFAIDHAAAVVHDAGHRSTDNYRSPWEGMGTTAVACLAIDASQIILGNVGDSRAYRLRRGRLQRLTRDHTRAQEYVDAQVLTEEEADHSYLRNVLTRNLGDKLGVIADMLELAVAPGDRILLCSDGLYSCVPTQVMESVLRSSETPRHAARALIEAALNSGVVSDNVTAVVLDVAPPTYTDCDVETLDTAVED